jgi:ribosomal protein S18 acetylase RimI-like enzyme
MPKKIRPMHERDVPAILAIQSECYEYLIQEDEATIRARFHTSPNTAWVAEDVHGVCAYLVAYRSRVGKVTPLGGHFEIPSAPDSLYLHDLAIAGRGKGSGLGAALIHCAWEQARSEGLNYSALVSVQNSHAFWRRHGYRDFANLDAAESANLQSYAGHAWYMVKDLHENSGIA